MYQHHKGMSSGRPSMTSSLYITTGAWKPFFSKKMTRPARLDLALGRVRELFFRQPKGGCLYWRQGVYLLGD